MFTRIEVLVDPSRIQYIDLCMATTGLKLEDVPDSSGSEDRRDRSPFHSSGTNDKNFQPKLSAAIGTVCTRRSQRKPYDILIHEFRLVVPQVRQISPYVASVVGVWMLSQFWWVPMPLQSFELPHASVRSERRCP